MTAAVSLAAIVAVAGLAATAVALAVKLGRARTDLGITRVRAEDYKRATSELRRDFARYQAATDAAVETLETALDSGDLRSALGIVRELPTYGRRFYDTRTDELPSDEPPADDSGGATDGLSDRRGLLGTLGGAGARVVGDSR